jgi:hypothetical protein
MNQLISIIIGLHVLVHSIFGCCDHALVAVSHSVSGKVCSHAVAKSEEGCRHEHKHREAVATHNASGEQSFAIDSSDQQSAPHERHECRHDSCHWLTSDALPTIDLLDSHCDAIYIQVNRAVIAAGAVSEFRLEAGFGRYRALPLRLHLTLGVLLI